MDFNWSSFESVLNNPTVSSLAQSLIPKSKPAAPPYYSPVISAPSPISAVESSGGGMSNNTMMMIGGGVLALIAILFLALKKK